MKYKIGQRVLILEPSEGHSNQHGCPLNIGDKGIITRYNGTQLYPYRVDFKSKGGVIYSHDYFDCELEPLVEVGEQLVFEFMKE